MTPRDGLPVPFPTTADLFARNMRFVRWLMTRTESSRFPTPHSEAAGRLEFAALACAQPLDREGETLQTRCAPVNVAPQ